NRLIGESLLHPAVHRLSGELLVHPRHRQIVLGFFSDVPDDEFEPLAGIDELQAVAEHAGAGELAISLALHHLLERLAIAGRHFLSALVDFRRLAHRASTSNTGLNITAPAASREPSLCAGKQSVVFEVRTTTPCPANGAEANMAKWIAVIVLGVLVVRGLSCVGSYNSLVTLDQGGQAQWGQVENVHQGRLDVVPDLLDTVNEAAAVDVG